MPAGEAGMEEPAPEEGGGEESALLAAPPGSRPSPRHEENPRRTKGDKGKLYYPKKPGSNDHNVGRRKVSLSSAPSELGRAPERQRVPGARAISNLAKINGLANGITEGVYGSEESIYSLREGIEEDKLFHINKSVRNLISELETKEKETKTEQKDEN